LSGCTTTSTTSTTTTTLQTTSMIPSIPDCTSNCITDPSAIASVIEIHKTNILAIKTIVNSSVPLYPQEYEMGELILRDDIRPNDWNAFNPAIVSSYRFDLMIDALDIVNDFVSKCSLGDACNAYFYSGNTLSYDYRFSEKGGTIEFTIGELKIDLIRWKFSLSYYIDGQEITWVKKEWVNRKNDMFTLEIYSNGVYQNYYYESETEFNYTKQNVFTNDLFYFSKSGLFTRFSLNDSITGYYLSVNENPSNRSVFLENYVNQEMEAIFEYEGSQYILRMNMFLFDEWDTLNYMPSNDLFPYSILTLDNERVYSDLNITFEWMNNRYYHVLGSLIIDESLLSEYSFPEDYQNHTPFSVLATKMESLLNTSDPLTLFDSSQIEVMNDCLHVVDYLTMYFNVEKDE